MNNPNEHQEYNREFRQDSYTDASGNIHNDVTRTTETVYHNEPTSYQKGYVESRLDEDVYQEQNLVVRDNNNASRGLLLGIILTTLVGLVIGVVFFLNQRNQETAPVQTVPVPVPTNNGNQSSSSKSSSEKQTTIIKEVPVPVPQLPSSSNPNDSTTAPSDSTVPTTAPKSSAEQRSSGTQIAPTQPQSLNSDGTTPNTASGNSNTSPTSPQSLNTNGVTTPNTASGNSNTSFQSTDVPSSSSSNTSSSSSDSPSSSDSNTYRNGTSSSTPSNSNTSSNSNSNGK